MEEKLSNELERSNSSPTPTLHAHYFAERLGGGELLERLLVAAVEGHLCIEDGGEHEVPEVVVRRGKLWYLARNFAVEERFVEGVRRLCQAEPTVPFEAQALCKAAGHCLTLLCGGPGTGKSTTAVRLIEEFVGTGGLVAVTAPTGKAVSNLKGRLPKVCHVTTLHRLLGKGPLPFDLILVDEAAMVDAERIAELFASVRTGTRLILVGDPAQLPPVEAGSLFADLVAALPDRVVRLTHCHRAELKEVLELAEAAREGKPIPFAPLPSLDALVEKIVAERPDCVLTPLRQGRYGAEALNRRLSERLTGPQPIMITVNDSYLELYNGDVGMLDGEEATFPDGRTFPKVLLPKFTLAYALSVHKSQGSEYNHVLVVIPEGAEKFGREVLYTAITRAKRKVEILAVPSILEALLAKHERRLSGVCARLRGISREEHLDCEPHHCREKA